MSLRLAVLSSLYLALIFSSPALAAPPTTDDLLKMCADKDAKLKSVSADFTVSGTIDGITMAGTGRAVVARVDGSRKYAFNFNFTARKDDIQQTGDISFVFDGKFVWQEIQNPAVGVVVQKKPAARAAREDVGLTFSPEYNQELKRRFDLAPVTEDSLEGLKVYVLEGVRRKGLPVDGPDRVPAKAAYYIDQKTLAVIRQLEFDADGTEIARADFSNVKFDLPVDKKLFVYTPPPDAKVKDMTAPPAK